MRKSSKKLLTLLLALAMILTFMPAMAFAESEDDGGSGQEPAAVQEEATEVVSGDEAAEEVSKEVPEEANEEGEERAEEEQAEEAAPAVLTAKNVSAKGNGELAITSLTVNKETSEENPVDTGEEITYTVECTGAEGVAVYPDWELYQWNQWREIFPEDGEEFDGKATGNVSYDQSGSHTIHVIAWGNYDEQTDTTDEVEADITVYVEASTGESIVFTEPDSIPSYIVAGENSKLEFTAALPENGDWMSVNVWFERDDYEGDSSLVSSYDQHDIEVKIENGKVKIENDEYYEFKEGDVIGINIYAGGAGYESAYLDYRIPVIASPSEDVQISLSNDEVLVNESTTATVAVAEGSEAEISRVQLYDGYGYWGEEEPDNGGAWSRDINFGEAGTFTVFAKVWLDGSVSYVVTEPKTVTVTSNGECGDFEVTAFKVNGTAQDLTGNSEESPLAVSRGDDIAVICSESENADNYWVDVDRYQTNEEDPEDGWFEENWKNYGYDQGDDPEVDFNSIELGEGLYRIRTHANSVGYERADAPTEVYIEVSDELGNEPILEVSKGCDSKDPLKSCEEFAVKAYIPGAEWIEIYWDADNNDDWRDDNWDHDGGESWYGNVSPYRSAGKFTIRAVGYTYDEEEDEATEVGSKKLTVYVEATAGEYTVTMPDLPSYIVAGSDASKNISFTVNLPKDSSGNKADGMIVNAWWNYDGNDEEVWERRDAEGFEDDLYWEETGDDSLEVSFDASSIPEDSTISVRVEAYGRDHEESSAEGKFPVIAEASGDVTIKADKTECYVNENVEFTVAAADGVAKIDRIRFFDGNGLWDEEGADEDGNYTREVSFGEAGTHSVYAKVLLEGSDTWVTCAPVTVTATTKGNLTIDRPSGLGAHYDPSDGALTFSVTKPSDADEMRVRVHDSDGNVEYECWGNVDEFPVKIAASRLEAGNTLSVEVGAWGVGYEYTWDEFDVEISAHEWGAWAVTKKATLTAAGTYTRTCSLDASHVQTKAIAKNNMTSAAKSKTLSAKAKKNTTFTAAKAFKVTNAKGALTYKKVSGNGKITVASNGKITVKKGLKKGKTFTVKVNVTSAATAEYAAATQTVTLKFKIK